MICTLLALGGVLLGVAICAPALFYQSRELRIAQDRLYSAWNVGAAIAPRPVEQKVAPIVPLSSALAAYVNDWEEPDARSRAESEIRELLNQGKSEREIIVMLENRALE